jgi:hypothetical protein
MLKVGLASEAALHSEGGSAEDENEALRGRWLRRGDSRAGYDLERVCLGASRRPYDDKVRRFGESELRLAGIPTTTVSPVAVDEPQRTLGLRNYRRSSKPANALGGPDIIALSVRIVAQRRFPATSTGPSAVVQTPIGTFPASERNPCSIAL